MNTEKNPTTGLILDVFGPTVEFLTSLEETQDNICVLKGMVPPGVIVPLHSHPDREDFIVISGEMQCLKQDTQSHEWIVAQVGDYVHVPGGVPHAWRNASNEPSLLFIITTKQMEQFFREAGRPTTSELQPPTLEELARFAAICDKYNYWIANSEENAAVGISLSF